MLARAGGLLIAGKYRLERLIARGGMGAVYQGRHVELDRPVAVKLLRHDVIADAQARERFRREARAVARIRHPNVADLYDYGALPEGDAYIVMELVRGETLRQHLERVGRLSVGEASRIGAQIAEGIEAAHRSGVVHRDLKPSNVVLCEERGDLQARVLDFSIAKFVDPEDGARLTASGAFLGTPQYMSPEQCSGEEPDARADVYGIGVILYEMLAGHLPFDGPAPAAVAVQQIQAAAPPLAFARPGVAPAIASLVRECLAKNPDQRPQTAGEVASRLRPFETEASTDPVAGPAPFPRPAPAVAPSADTNPTGALPRSVPPHGEGGTSGTDPAPDPEPTGLTYWRSLDTRERGGRRVPPGPWRFTAHWRRRSPARASFSGSRSKSCPLPPSPRQGPHLRDASEPSGRRRAAPGSPGRRRTPSGDPGRRRTLSGGPAAEERHPATPAIYPTLPPAAIPAAARQARALPPARSVNRRPGLASRPQGSSIRSRRTRPRPSTGRSRAGSPRRTPGTSPRT